MIKYDSKRALELLRLGTNDPKANFREGQEEAIKCLIVGNSRLLIVQKTGWGKSFVYFIATKLLREARLGPVLLFSPLLALMRNQLEAAKKIGVRAFTINCTNSDNWEEIETKIKKDEVDILLVSPERLSNERFQQGILSRIARKVSMLVVDEAHCISDWGHDFRPHYRMIGRIVKGLPANMRVLATTATANDRVMEDLRSVLGKEIQVYRGDLNRENLILQTIKLNSKAGRLAWLAEKLPSISGSGIVYTLTIKEANLVASWLASRGLKSLPYSSESENREELEDALINDRVKVLVATSALGMGFDKPNISFVVHFQTPASVISYYQQVGRAGRKIPRAYGVLLVDEESFKIDNWFVENAFPTSEEAQEVLDTLKRFPQGLSIKQMLPNINLPEGRIEKVLTLLSLESPAPVVKENGKWFLTIEEVKHEFWERIERIKKIKRKEIAQMKEYTKLPFGEHMPFLISALDGDTSKVSLPYAPELNSSVDHQLVLDAQKFIYDYQNILVPRKKWPTGGLPIYGVRGNLPPEGRAELGRALSYWEDGGWGPLVSRGKYVDHYFADELVHACVELLLKWKPDPFPQWVTCIPSLRHPELVPDFACRLASALGIPFYNAIRQTKLCPEQKSMKNSAQQARNLDGLFEIQKPLPQGPVLLVDDMVDSGWTMTIAAFLLRKNGSGKVWPLALSNTGTK